jgi:DNA-binding NarL/FixJ family response regulator
MYVGICTRSEVIQIGLETVLASAHHTYKRLPLDLDVLIAEVDSALNVIITTDIIIAKSLAKATNIILLTHGETESSLSGLIQAGVRMILPIDAPVRLLMGTLDLMADGIQITPRIDGVMLALQLSVTAALGARLLPRDLPVIKLVATGKTNAEIAQVLGLTEGTVKKYVSSAIHKLGFKNRTELALWAVESGLHPDR